MSAPDSSRLPPPASGHPATGGSAALALRCENLHRYLGEGEGRVHVLRGVSFEARRGQVTAIVGPSGCGKSTLLYLLGLLDQPDAGSIWISDRLMSNSSDLERTAARCAHIGFVFQFHFLMQEFSALDNVMMPMRKLGRWDEIQMADRARSLLTDVGLGDKTHRLATQLSGGEQQRVAVARALANQPDIILADEPTGNLDVKNSALVFDLLTRLAKENGQAVVLVTHNPDIANRCDETKPMRDGEFVRYGGAEHKVGAIAPNRLRCPNGRCGQRPLPVLIFLGTMDDSSAAARLRRVYPTICERNSPRFGTKNELPGPWVRKFVLHWSNGFFPLLRI